MGLSFKKKNKKSKPEDVADETKKDSSTKINTNSTTAPKKKKKFGRKSRAPSPEMDKNTSAPEPTEPTMSMVPELTSDLETAENTSGEQSARSLRMLFALSEHSTTENNRAVMVQGNDGKLVPALLNFLKRCDRSSSEQYLALLVLNNVSIPAENKRPIAIEYGGAKVLSRLLCEDPSCHLLAIILVNLTFADGDLRRELVASHFDIDLVEALSYALLIASSTAEEQSARAALTSEQEYSEDSTPAQMLESAMKADALIHKSPDGVAQARHFYPDKQIFPETARWCLSALKNMTRPSRDSKVARAVADSGIIPLILRIITVGGPSHYEETRVNISSNSDLARDLHMSEQQYGSKNNETASTSDFTELPASPASASSGNNDNGDVTNLPSSWEANSIQDAAIFTIMNLAAEAPVRPILSDEDAVNILSSIADYSTMSTSKEVSTDEPTVGEKQQQFQCLKARMALAYLVGSEGHFGQPRETSSGNSGSTHMHDSVLLVTNAEAERLIELLSNTLHLRSKEGAGGYSAATFTVKSVLCAIRCLLTNHINQITFATTGVRLNCLLLKAISYFALNLVPTVDAEAAEYALFSLYLQSSYGFHDDFLPAYLGPEDDYDDATESDSLERRKKKISITEKILKSALDIENITAPGRHAATQMLLRLVYLKFGGYLEQLDQYGGSLLSASDFDLGEEVRIAIEDITVERTPPGAKPLKAIFGRPILRSRAPKKGEDGAPWNQQTSVSIFPSALLAVQPLSFGSVKVRHMEAIDDIQIANNIACSARGEKTESYNYWWSWQDAAHSIQEKLQRKEASRSSMKSFMERMSSTQGDEDGPFTIFGLKCGPGGLCRS